MNCPITERSKMEFFTRMVCNLALAEIEKGSNKNIAVSPTSFHVALSMLAVGAQGATLDQLLGVLEAQNVDALIDTVGSLVAAFAAPPPGNGGDVKTRLAFANGLWVADGFRLNPKFQQKVKSIFHAEANTADFANKPEETRLEVNSWVEKVTENLIKDFIGANSFKSSAKLILVNAVYFKGAWDILFDPKKTRDREFHLINGEIAKVPFMTSDTIGYKNFYGSFSDFNVLKLPYGEGLESTNFFFYIFLPHRRDGLRDLIAETLDSNSRVLQDCFDRLRLKKLERMWIPKLKFSYGFEARSVMKELGLTQPFKMTGDFKEVADDGGDLLYVTKILSKCYIDVNEAGTEAAAASKLGMACGCSMNAPIPVRPSFVADHPFLFLIREDVSGVVLFTGAVLNPLL